MGPDGADRPRGGAVSVLLCDLRETQQETQLLCHCVQVHSTGRYPGMYYSCVSTSIEVEGGTKLCVTMTCLYLGMYHCSASIPIKVEGGTTLCVRCLVTTGISVCR